MRILFVHNQYQYRGGEDTVFEQEVAALRALGHAVETIIFSNEQLFSGSVFDKLTAAVSTFYNRASARQVEQLINTFRPDVLHIHNLFYMASPAVIQAAKRRNVPVVMTLHNYRLVCVSGLLMRPAEVPCERCLTKTVPLDGIRFGCFRESRSQSAQLTAITSLHKMAGTWQKVDRYVTLTPFARQKMLTSSLRLRPEQVVVKPNFVPDLGYVDPDERDDFFLFVGRLSPEKGLNVLLEAIRHVPVPLEIIGTGPLESEVKATAAERAQVRYRGSLPRTDVIERMRRCRAVVVPSIWYEGLPTVILEAFATGTPVICSDQDNLNEIVTDGQTGFLFKTGQSASLASLLLRLTQQPQQLASAGQAGRRVFEETYAESVVMNRLLALYKEVANPKVAAV